MKIVLLLWLSQYYLYFIMLHFCAWVFGEYGLNLSFIEANENARKIKRMRTFKDLIVWQKATELAEAAYVFVKLLPDGERYGLVTQIQRSAVSVASNISEGAGRSTKKDYAHFLDMARGSLNELDTQIYLARRLHLNKLEFTDLDSLIDQVGRMINGLHSSILNSDLQSKLNRPQRP